MKQSGLVLFAGLLLALAGGLAWVGFAVPAPTSCVALTVESLKAPDRPDLKTRALKACRHSRASS